MMPLEAAMMQGSEKSILTPAVEERQQILLLPGATQVRLVPAEHAFARKYRIRAI
jgi:hypothetical protein